MLFPLRFQSKNGEFLRRFFSFVFLNNRNRTYYRESARSRIDARNTFHRPSLSQRRPLRSSRVCSNRSPSHNFRSSFAAYYSYGNNRNPFRSFVYCRCSSNNRNRSS